MIYYNLKNKKMKNKIINVIGFALIVFTLGTCISFFVAKAYNREPYLKSMNLQTIYNKEQYEACMAEKTLAIGKLQDYSNGLLEFKEEDLLRLHGKRNLDCPQ